jgi:hypothetical protein
MFVLNIGRRVGIVSGVNNCNEWKAKKATHGNKNRRNYELLELAAVRLFHFRFGTYEFRRMIFVTQNTPEFCQLKQ